MTTYYHQVEDAVSALRAIKEDYLRRFGWVSTCNTPGAYWLWRRDFADEDARQLEWWVQHTTPEQRKKDFGPGMPSKPTPYGIVTADLDLAVSMTVKCLDEQPELGDDDAC